ncbi:Dol-P-Glc:Glc(2)Man(9)GlcNAc(2)-PP-Dol alpha-1,2-glucosyltransferase [Salinibius halmophilus]|uniref:hypothetical protein n=1 Tax=Salinibius halmophilus TaxID=1853216 RepID=UPI000E6753A6|nr:hypothetical protein [Salinibius halmophilus]
MTQALKQGLSAHHKDDITLSAILLVLVVGVTFYLGLQMMPEHSYFHDEFFHYPQIKEFSEGIFDDVSDKLTMLPGYHAMVAAVAWVIGDNSIPATRVISAFLSLPALIFFFLCAKDLGKPNRYTVSLLFYSSPIIFPYFFVLYTDMVSLMLLLASFFFTLKRHYQVAALIAFASLFVRQTNII